MKVRSIYFKNILLSFIYKIKNLFNTFYIYNYILPPINHKKISFFLNFN